METGLLWYDGDPKRPLEDKVGRAAERYRQKFGRWPNTCYVHPQVVGPRAGEGLRLPCQAKSSKATTIRVLSAPNILVHHFWLGETSERDGDNGRRAA